MIQGIVMLLMLVSCTEFPAVVEKDILEETLEGGEEIGPTNAFFVAPDGDDRNPGTKDEPWATWEKAFNSTQIQPGDTVYFRGGVYYYPSEVGGYGIDCDVSGAPGRLVHYMNYPGERPVLDCSNIERLDGTHNYPLYIGKIEYVHFRGLTVRNVFQLGGESEVVAWNIGRSYNVILENCTVYNTHGIGFRCLESDEVYYVNCDSYNNCDIHTTVPANNPMPGNDGSGFQDYNQENQQASTYFIDCRAWNCGDQGFSSGSIGYTEYEGCWSFNNGLLEGGGHGFKMGWISDPNPNVLNRLYKNCIAAYNRQYGFVTNDQGYECGTIHAFNNTAYHNGYYSDWNRPATGFYVFNTRDSESIERGRVYRNNLSYGNQSGNIIVGKGAAFTSDHNSWDSPPGIPLSSDLFVTTDSTGLSGPRQADGSLPELDFLKLAPGSPAIDAGTTSTGLDYKGSAPDLGAYEME